MKTCSPNAVVCVGGMFAHVPQLYLDLFIHLWCFYLEATGRTWTLGLCGETPAFCQLSHPPWNFPIPHII